MVQQPPVGQSLLIIETSRLYSDTLDSAGSPSQRRLDSSWNVMAQGDVQGGGEVKGKLGNGWGSQ